MGNIITIFNGNSSNLPYRWRICDGTNDTPDLRDLFIKGVASFQEIGEVGDGKHTHTLEQSSTTHNHGSYSGGSHTHGYSYDYRKVQYNSYYVSKIHEASHSHTNSTNSTTHTHQVGEGVAIPPYYRLCYVVIPEYNWNFPVGSIVMWTGAEGELPGGWAFCDGSGGTIDLRNRFIKGGTTRGVTGSGKHTHTVPSGGSHTHSFQSTSFSHTHEIDYSSGTISKDTQTTGPDYAGPSHSHTAYNAGAHSHAVSEASNDPPYYKLAFIQRIF